MQSKRVAMQVATVFIGSIVGAGLSSGRELNQFFGVYGYKSLIGLILCGLSYVVVGHMIVEISVKYGARSYNEFVSLVCPKAIAWFTNIILTLFLISSTAIIFAGSSAVIQQYFGLPKIVGFIIMFGCSLFFLLRNTTGLFEVNNVIVPCLLVTMTLIFIGVVRNDGQLFSITSLQNLPCRTTSYLPSTIIYAGFNIISIIGVIAPIAQEIKDKQAIKNGIVMGTIGLTLMSFFITLLMITHPEYPRHYQIPLLAVAKEVGKVIQTALLVVIWLEMFSSQIANIYSLTKGLESQWNIYYKQGIFLISIIAIPFSLFGFSRLVEVLYPLYGVLSLAFVVCVIIFYIKPKICIISKKDKNKISHRHNI